MRVSAATTVTAAMFLVSADAWAIGTAGRCESGKLRTAARYASCRLHANAALAKRGGGTPALARCDARFSVRWKRAEVHGTHQCLTTGDGLAVQAFVAQCTDGVASALAGGPVPTCGGTQASLPLAPALGGGLRASSDRCESAKLKAAATYYFCRLKPDASSAACDARLSADWGRAQADNAGQCLSTSDQPSIQTLVGQCADGVSNAVTGGQLPTCSPSDDWTVVNHDHRNSRDNTAETGISTENVNQLAPRWRVDGLSAVTSTPAVVAGIAYLGDWSGVVHALRTADGTEVWRHELASAVRPSPLVAGDRVYVPESNGRLWALRRDTGDVVWSAPLDTQPLLSIDSSPVLAGNTIVIGVASFEQGIRKADYTFRGNIVGLNADTGEARWRVYTSENDATSGAGVSVWSSAAVDEIRKLVFIGTGQTYEQPASPRGDSLIAVYYETGQVAWVHQFTAGDVFTIAGGGPGPDADVGASPNLFAIGSRDVVGVGQKNGFYHVLDRDTGAVVWERQLTTGSPLGGIMVTAAVHDGVIYVNSNQWRVFGFVTTGVNNPLDTSSTFALDSRDGTVLWQRAMPAPMFGGMTVANGVVYHGTIDGTVHAVSAADGTELWSDHPGGSIGGGASVVGGTVYVGRGLWFFTPPATPDGGFVAYGLTQQSVGTSSPGPEPIVSPPRPALPAGSPTAPSPRGAPGSRDRALP